jgi:hypothetical protein
MIRIIQNLFGDRDGRSQRGVDPTPRCVFGTPGFRRMAARMAGCFSGVLFVALATGVGPAAAGVKVRDLRIASFSGDTLTMACELRASKRNPANPDSLVRYRLLVSVEGDSAACDSAWRTVAMPRDGRVTVKECIVGFVAPPEARLSFSIQLDEAGKVRTAGQRRRPLKTRSTARGAGPFPARAADLTDGSGWPDEYPVSGTVYEAPRITWGMLKVIYSSEHAAASRSGAGGTSVGQAGGGAPAGGAYHDRNARRLPAARPRDPR